MKNAKNVDLEFMRVIACFFVIYTHTNLNGFLLYTQREIGGISYFAYMLTSIFCKFAVPMFFAISSALLLVKEESLKEICKKRVSRIVVILVLYSFFYFLVEIYRGNQMFDIGLFFERLITSNWNYSYWYLYAFIAFLLCAPILGTVVKNLEGKYFIYIFVFTVIINGVLPILEYLLWENELSFNTYLQPSGLLLDFFAYACVGYYLYYKLDYNKVSRRNIIVLWSINIITMVLACYVTYKKTIATDYVMEQSYLGIFGLMNCAVLFLTIRYVFQRYKISDKLVIVIRSIGGCTFNIYLLHVFIMGLFSEVKNKLQAIPWLNDMLAIFIYCFLVMLAGYVVTLVMKRIPGLNKLI